MNNILLVAIVLVVGFGGWYVLSMGNSNEAAIITDSQSDPATLQENDADMRAEMEMEMDMDMGTDVVSEADPATSGMNDAPADLGTVFTVKGVNYAFDVDEIRVKEGDTVTINFESSDGFHDWVVDEFDAATAQVRPGTPTSVTFVASKAGTYEYYCSVGSHRAQGMVGNLIVE